MASGAESPAQVLLVLQVLQVPLLGRIRCHQVWLVCAYFLLHRAWCHPEGGIVLLSNDNRPWLLAELWRCRMHWLWAVRCVTAKKSRKNNPLSPGVGSSNLTAFLVSAFFVVLTFLALPEAREVR